MENAVVLSFKSRLKSAQVALEGFPWKLATILYTLSWGWSLLRPNTLYWDDWQFREDWQLAGLDLPTELWSKRLLEGIAPWSSIIEMLLSIFGIWPIRVATFSLFFATALFFYGILRSGLEFISPTAIRLATLIFLVVPVNHARVALMTFDYTTSYFAFFLGWILLVRSATTKSFLLACITLFFSFKTHSLLFFALLPLLHFGWLNRSRNQTTKRQTITYIKIFVVTILPLIYVTSRTILWPPKANMKYHSVYSNGLLMSLTLFIPLLILLLNCFFLFSSKRFISKELKILVIGSFATALALTPYLIANKINRYIFLINISWESRHLMLTPLGIAFVVIGVNQIISKRSQFVVKLALTLSVSLNTFVGAQYYVHSIQQVEIIELFKRQEIPIVIAEFVDETERFKGRGGWFDDYEFFGMLNEAGYSYPKRVGYKYVCKANPDGAKLTVKSDKTFLDALLSRNTGTYFEITKCAEDLSP